MSSRNIKTIFDIGLVPLVTLDNVADAVPFGKALVAGDIPIAEVTFRTNACLKSIQAMRREVPGLIVGAGTVHTVEQAKNAVNAGAEFIVTPAFNPSVIEWCIDNHIDIIPGTISPADIESAIGFGIEVCKFFPAAAYGGVKTLQALAGPFKQMKFLPTGGITYDNMNDYLNLSNVAAVGGSFMTPSTLVHTKNWQGITQNCKNVVRHLFDFTLGHVGLHVPGRKEAESIADGLCRLMLKDKKTGVDNFFVGTFAEICDHEMPGVNGHICLDTRDISRVMAYYKRHNIGINEDLCFRDDDGQIKVFFLKETVGGFSIHFRKK
jgi:2-dehydro-3-deoxyphosphogluconate aldolase/(4S)-4-hydroxy-2-oxoglutarate aldolase